MDLPLRHSEKKTLACTDSKNLVVVVERRLHNSARGFTAHVGNDEIIYWGYLKEPSDLNFSKALLLCLPWIVHKENYAGTPHQIYSWTSWILGHLSINWGRLGSGGGGGKPI